MNQSLRFVREIASEIETFPLGKCGPSDDPDKQTAYLYTFRDIATRFVASVRRLGDDSLNEMIAGLNLRPEFIEDAYTLHAELRCVVDALQEIDDETLVKRRLALATPFIDEKIISELQGVKFPNLDTSKLVRLCEELNDCYTRGNYMACLLLIRAMMNHVPPIFGFRTFEEVVAGSGRSVKKILSTLQDTARPISDFHNHALMRSKETLPTRSQVEPYRGNFEMLMTELIAKGETHRS